VVFGEICLVKSLLSEETEQIKGDINKGRV